MKTNIKLWIAALLLVATSCSEKIDEQNRNNGSSPETEQAYTRTLEDAVLHAQTMFEQNGVTRAGGGLALADYKIYNTAPATRSGGNEEASFYVLNFADNGGYAIVPVDSRTTPVYAYSTTGNIDIDEAVENTGFGVFMEYAAEYYHYEIANILLGTDPGDRIPPILPPWDGTGDITEDVTKYMVTEYDGKMYYTKQETSIDTVEPLLTTLWSQGYPYNNFTPTRNGAHTPAGCAPIAMAQIMAYYEYPTKCGNYTLDWGDIKSKATVAGQASYADAVAYFIRDIGKTAGTVYGAKNSSTLNTRIRSTLKSYGYSVSKREDYNINTVISSLNKKYPVYVMGQRTTLNGHSWVIDGYTRYSTTFWYYNMTRPYALYKTVPNCYVKEYVNCNWGWGDNGSPTLCLSGVFEVEVTNNGKTEIRNYSNNVKTIANIHL